MWTFLYSNVNDIFYQFKSRRKSAKEGTHLSDLIDVSNYSYPKVV